MLEVIPSVVQIEDIPLEEASTEAPKKPNLTLQITSSNKDLLDTSGKSLHIIKKEPDEKNIVQIDLMSPTKNNSKEDEIDGRAVAKMESHSKREKICITLPSADTGTR
ncbi:hypothetical protein HDV04_002958 [Boothiomyces sp. JEL0838]|nr:hypothetical protein HDV04_002958 [Boothiomyces sp. JEL0838]